MSVQNGRAFHEWLRSQLKAKKMSQRQLAQQSGVDHSTISRLIRGERTPSLGTATKLGRGLHEIHDEADTPQYFGLVASAATNPTADVEYSLRADEYLNEAQVRQVMEYYLAVRMGRLAARPMAVRPGATHLVRFPKRNQHIVRPASPPGLGKRSTLDEDGAEGPAQRGREVQAQQPGAVDVTELGSHIARPLPGATRRARRDRCAAPILDRD
jgi:transcriptional regulator with XRE-family HTH domain